MRILCRERAWKRFAAKAFQLRCASNTAMIGRSLGFLPFLAFVCLFWAPDDVLVAQASGVATDEDFITRFARRATATQSKQPGWSVPLLAPHAGLIQSYRADFTRRSNIDDTFVWDYGGSKGFNFIPLPNTQIDINQPAFIDRSNDAASGFGDMSLGLKYRVTTRNERSGNYSAMVGMAATFPTSNTRNGQTHHVLTPNLAVGKGWGRWDVQSSATMNLPIGNTAAIGRNVVWNTLVQAKVGKYFWPELESNTTFFQGGGTNNGRTQSFLLPGVMSKFRLAPTSKGPKASRLTLATGVGWQFAVTPFRTYNNTPVASIRLGF